MGLLEKLGLRKVDSLNRCVGCIFDAPFEGNNFCGVGLSERVDIRQLSGRRIKELPLCPEGLKACEKFVPRA